VERSDVRTQLDRLQRLVSTAITGDMRTAPTRALEVLLNFVPLTIHIKMEAIGAAYYAHYGSITSLHVWTLLYMGLGH